MPMHRSRKCTECGKDYVPTGPAARYCAECGLIRRKKADAAKVKAYRIRQGCQVGVGKGGANAKGSMDDQYRTGISWFNKIRRSIKTDRRRCNSCGKDLVNASRYQWVIHHRDHDRTNNVMHNLELLCKRCHQIEHNCHKAFKA